MRNGKSHVEDVPPEFPESTQGINLATDEMPQKDWLSLVAVHGDVWLFSVTFKIVFRQ